MRVSLEKAIMTVEKAHQAFHGEEVEFISIKDYMVAITVVLDHVKAGMMKQHPGPHKGGNGV